MNKTTSILIRALYGMTIGAAMIGAGSYLTYRTITGQLDLVVEGNGWVLKLATEYPGLLLVALGTIILVAYRPGSSSSVTTSSDLKFRDGSSGSRQNPSEVVSARTTVTEDTQMAGSQGRDSPEARKTILQSFPEFQSTTVEHRRDEDWQQSALSHPAYSQKPKTRRRMRWFRGRS